MGVTRIAPGLHCLSLGIVNAFLIEDGGDLCLIDTGLPGSEGKILDAIATLGRSAGDLKHIVLTHAHDDHLGSAAALVEATGATTWMHPLDAPIAEGREQPRPITPAPDLLNRTMYFFLSRSKQTPPRPFAVDHRLADGDELPFAGGCVRYTCPATPRARSPYCGRGSRRCSWRTSARTNSGWVRRWATRIAPRASAASGISQVSTFRSHASATDARSDETLRLG
jgi:glyoxylase-like metal-dependent hydrolase (beta-lactamase superfamily II)